MGFLTNLLRDARCAGCGHASTRELCADCIDTLEHCPTNEALFIYDGPVQHIVLRWKDHHDSCDPLLSRISPELLPKVDIVVPVPPSFWRTLRRGVHPPDDLARFIAHAVGARLSPRALRRLDDTPQMGKGARARRARETPLFAATSRARALRGKRVLIVDDVRTTGTTLREAELALRKAGVGDVLTLALAAAL